MGRLPPEGELSALSSEEESGELMQQAKHQLRERIEAYRAAALQCLQNAEMVGHPSLKIRWASRAIEWLGEVAALEKQL